MPWLSLRSLLAKSAAAASLRTWRPGGEGRGGEGGGQGTRAPYIQLRGTYVKPCNTHVLLVA